MDNKLAAGSLVVFIVVIFAFAGSMAWFILFKESVCATSLASPDCIESYSAFLHNLFVR